MKLVEPDPVMTTTADPNDADWDRQWEMLGTADGIGITRAWNFADGRGAVVLPGCSPGSPSMG